MIGSIRQICSNVLEYLGNRAPQLRFWFQKLRYDAKCMPDTSSMYTQL